MEQDRPADPGVSLPDDPADLLGPGPAGGGLGARLERWAAEVRVDEAARRRSHERWLLQQAEEEGTFAGVLVDLAERGAQVAVHTRSGGRHVGRIGVVGADFVGVRSSFGGDALVRVDVIATVRTQPGERSTAGDRLLAARLTLAEVLARLAGDRERVTLVLDGAGAVGGTLRSVGADVVAVRLEGGGPAATSYVPLAAVGEVLVGA